MTVGPSRINGLANAMRESVIEEAGEGLGIVSLGKGHYWFFGKMENVLVIRPEYNIIWKMIIDSYTILQEYVKSNQSGIKVEKPDYVRIIIVGNSGIGKTMSMNTYIREAIKKGTKCGGNDCYPSRPARKIRIASRC